MEEREATCIRGLRSLARFRARVPDAQVTFVGTAAGLEARVIPREGFPLDVIRSAGLKGKSIGPLHSRAGPVAGQCCDAWNVVRRRHPSVVVGVGGYSSRTGRSDRGASRYSDAAPRTERDARHD